MSEPAMLFKVLSADGRSCHGGDLQWPLPTQRSDGTWAPGEPVKVAGKVVPCKNGIHLATARQVLTDWMGERIWVAQWRGELVDADNKWVAREVRLLHPTAWDDWIARHFACDCAERVLHLTADPRTADAIRIARLFAEGKATVEQRDAAAEAAAWVAAEAAAGAAAEAAARAAWAAAEAAWAAAEAAARAAERDWQEARLLYYLQGGQPNE